MTQTATPNVTDVDPRLLEVLICPVTRTALTYDRAKGELVSHSSGLEFRVMDSDPRRIRKLRVRRRAADGKAAAE